MIEQVMHDQLETRAEGVVSDIRGDAEADGRAEGMDFGYNLYIEELPTFPGSGSFITYGLIDMGELYQQAFTWDHQEGGWHETFEVDPYELEERILRNRRLAGSF